MFRSLWAYNFLNHFTVLHHSSKWKSPIVITSVVNISRSTKRITKSKFRWNFIAIFDVIERKWIRGGDRPTGRISPSRWKMIRGCWLLVEGVLAIGSEKADLRYRRVDAAIGGGNCYPIDWRKGLAKDGCDVTGNSSPIIGLVIGSLSSVISSRFNFNASFTLLYRIFSSIPQQ